jgi:predicted O-methyltransferase YrrM
VKAPYFAALFNRHGTDKEVLHGYGATYDELLAAKSDVRAVLEVGVYKGFSLNAWAEAWPEAEVYGVDVRDRRKSEPHPRVHVVLADATLWMVRDFLPREVQFDLIVDDGSHKLVDQVLTAGVLLPLLAPGGVYVIEDVASPRKGRHLRRLIRPGYTAWQFEISGPHKRYDDRLVVLRRATA